MRLHIAPDSVEAVVTVARKRLHQAHAAAPETKSSTRKRANMTKQQQRSEKGWRVNERNKRLSLEWVK